ncbi:MAG TPA: CPXCG motif-containing cysteine-rich protein [Gemmatimonadaceae bacterium]|nr:CPXCG motif-containing cysteine-rich protein [Gemmatimonadaceae bacterium]
MRFADEFPDDHARDFLHDAEGDDLELDSGLEEGTADTDAIVACPYCAELVTIGLDPGGGVTQKYVEDCQVCCRPWLVGVAYQRDGTAIVSLTALDQ